MIEEGRGVRSPAAGAPRWAPGRPGRALRAVRGAMPAALAFGVLSAVAACFAAAAATAAGEATRPATPSDDVADRIVSLDYCADQFVLGLADRGRILAVSPDAGAGFSYLRRRAAGLPAVRPRTEDVLLLKPGLVVRTYGGGPNVRAFFERAGVPVLQIGYAEDLDGVRAVVRAAAGGLGVPERGEGLIAGMDARLARMRTHPAGTAALYLTPSGVTAGPDTLIHRLLASAGLDNFQSRSGWRPLPLERLAYETPDLVALARFGARADHEDAWTPFRHPVVRRRVRSAPVAALDGATTSCAGWFLADAVEALAAAADPVSRRFQGIRPAPAAKCDGHGSPCASGGGRNARAAVPVRARQ